MKLEDVFYVVDNNNTPSKFQRDEDYNDIYWEIPFGGEESTWKEHLVKERINEGNIKILPKEEWLKNF